jgi:hypothetical protein
VNKPASPTKRRDERLDFFRGVTMFIIFVAHADTNPLNDWIPARFGFSSGAEVFVFCSGCASAFAFGSVFLRNGFALGAARVAYRIWQVYWAHICVALVVIAAMSLTQRVLPASDLRLDPLPQVTADPAGALLGLLTLSWLPAFLDILPMYLVLLALIPAMQAARRLHAVLPFALSFVLYATVWLRGINLPGNPWTGEQWFFNPFAWQAIFFSGFAFSSGWLPVPKLRTRWLMTACIAFLAASMVVIFRGFHDVMPLLDVVSRAVLTSSEKTDLHPLRLMHFLALAYVTLSLVEPYRNRLSAGAGRIIVGVGQQSLAVFLASLVTARIASLVFQMFGTGWLVTGLVNLCGAFVIIGTARTARWFKSMPWQKAPPIKIATSRAARAIPSEQPAPPSSEAARAA